jgi:hypothetical protein
MVGCFGGRTRVSISLNVGNWGGLYSDDREAVEAFSNLIWAIQDGPVSAEQGAAYRQFRELLLRNEEFTDVVPPLVRGCRTAEQFQDMLAKLETKDSHRINDVLDTTNALKARAEELNKSRRRAALAVLSEDLDGREPGTTSREAVSGWHDYFFPNESATATPEAEAASWTGVTGRAAKLVAVRSHIQVAYVAVDQLINELSSDEGNCGPLLDEHCDAIEALRELHKCLGTLLDAIDGGQLNDELGSGFAAEIARLGSRAVDDIRDDPARHAFGLSILALLSLCGLADLGGSLAGYALGIRKKQKQGQADETLER